MLKRLFKGVVYVLGICTLIAIIATACEDKESTYIEETENGAVLVVPEETDSEVEIIKPEEVQEYEEDFVFVEGPTCVPGEFSSNIVGVVKNNTNKDYSYLQITFTLYDIDGNVVGSAFANVNNIKAGGTWKFEAMFFEDNAATWELDEITGW